MCLYLNICVKLIFAINGKHTYIKNQLAGKPCSSFDV